MIANGETLPGYLKNHVLYYAGPAKTPPGRASGAFGPTTGRRMDPYVPELQERGASLIMLAKGSRSASVTASCQAHGGFYLGTPGGIAARIGHDCIKRVEVCDFPELGMEAVHRIEVADFPAFLVIDNQGNDLYQRLLKGD